MWKSGVKGGIEPKRFLPHLFSNIHKKKKKKNQILNFEFQNSKIQQKKINVGYTFWFYLHEPRSSQAIKPLSWDLEPRPFQDPILWATESWFKPLSHDLSKPRSISSYNPSHRASQPRSEPSSRDTSQAELSRIF